MCCAPCCAMDSTSLFRTDALLAGDTNDGDASTLDPDMRSIEGVVEPCPPVQLITRSPSRMFVTNTVKLKSEMKAMKRKTPEAARTSFVL